MWAESFVMVMRIKLMDDLDPLKQLWHSIQAGGYLPSDIPGMLPTPAGIPGTPGMFPTMGKQDLEFPET